MSLILSCLLFAPAPPPKEVRPVLDEDLKSVKAVVWKGHTYPVAFSADEGVYRCDNHAGADVCWTGTFEVRPGGEVILREQRWACRAGGQWAPDGDPYDARLRLRWEKGRLVGTGWNEPITLSR